MSLSEATWAEIARLWREGREPVGVIAGRFGISHQRICAVARSGQWPQRGGKGGKGGKTRVEPPTEAGGTHGREPAPAKGRRALPSADGRSASAKRRRPRKRRPASRETALQQMVERLFDAMETKLSNIEHRIADGGDETSADSERTARSLGTLIRNLERLSEYERKLLKTAAASGGKTGGERDDTERRRQELAQRIARLLERR